MQYMHTNWINSTPSQQNQYLIGMVLVTKETLKTPFCFVHLEWEVNHSWEMINIYNDAIHAHQLDKLNSFPAKPVFNRYGFSYKANI